MNNHKTYCIAIEYTEDKTDRKYCGCKITMFDTFKAMQERYTELKNLYRNCGNFKDNGYMFSASYVVWKNINQYETISFLCNMYDIPTGQEIYFGPYSIKEQ